jgi:hypothetical protein
MKLEVVEGKYDEIRDGKIWVLRLLLIKNYVLTKKMNFGIFVIKKI